MSYDLNINGGLSKLTIPVKLTSDEISTIVNFSMNRKRWFWLGNFHSIDIPLNMLRPIIDRVGVEPTSSLSMVTMPYKQIPIHIDTRYGHRKTCVTWCVMPELENASSTFFHDNDGKVVYEHKYDGNALIMNTMYPHAMSNNGHRRLLFQLTYDKTPQEVYELSNK